MASRCSFVGALLGIALVGCAAPEALTTPTAGGKSGSGGSGTTTTVGSGGSTSSTTASGGATARGGTSSTITASGGATARGGATTTLGSGGSTFTTATPTCTDRIKNGDETDVDCGGTCATKCAFGKACTVDTDCTINVCSSGLCTTCKNTTKDGDETDVDCGGSCPRCVEGQACATVKDCATYNCDKTTLLCGPTTNCLAAIPDSCTCAKNVVNAGDAVGCQKVIDCYLTNACKPGDACTASNDAVCGSNTLGVDAGKAGAAVKVYTCACGA